uniref:Dipeptidase n=1 Tax=Timspurckia oligopyrenoides TaxID=708627 RepID=A0A7S0ZI39_9RHOD
MGCNSAGVVIGNEAVYTKVPYEAEPALLGMDLIRLTLEKAASAKDALRILTEFLEKYGQGGDCSADRDGWQYHNSFILADSTEAFVLETAGRTWVAEVVTRGPRSISNNLSIHKHDFSSRDLVEKARALGWKGDSEDDLDFAAVFAAGGCDPDQRELCGRSLLANATSNGSMQVEDMVEILRSHKGSICMHGGFSSTSSQVSLLTRAGNDVHLFTGSSWPCSSIFKPIDVSSATEYSSDAFELSTELWNAQRRMLSGLYRDSAQLDAIRDAQRLTEKDWLDYFREHKKSKIPFKNALEEELALYRKLAP